MGIMKLNDVDYSSGGGIELTETLTAGQTTVTFTDPYITAASLIHVYGNLWYTNIQQTTGSATLTFPVQTTDIDITILIR